MGKQKKLQEVSGPVSVLPLIRGVFNLKQEIFDEISKKDTHKNRLRATASTFSRRNFDKEH